MHRVVYASSSLGARVLTCLKHTEDLEAVSTYAILKEIRPAGHGSLRSIGLIFRFESFLCRLKSLNEIYC